MPDLHDADRWAAHCLRIVGPVDVAYGNDDDTLLLFERERTKVVRPGLWDRAQLEASAIRLLLAEDDPSWRKAVPKEVAALLQQWKATERLQRLG